MKSLKSNLSFLNSSAFNSKLFKQKKDHAFQIYLLGLTSSEKSQSTLEKEDLGKKSKTPTSPKQKPAAKLTALPRKSSQTLANASSGAFSDELSAHFNSNFYGSFVQSLISKAICMSASEIAKKQPFEHIADLSLNVKTYLDIGYISLDFNKYLYF